MASEPILSAWSLPLSKFTFADAQALAQFLNKRELEESEIIFTLGHYTASGSQEPAGLFYEYRPREIGEDVPAKRLHIVPVANAWETFVDSRIDRFEFVDRSEVILGGRKVEVALLREREQPLTPAAGKLTTTAPGWEWLVPQIDGNDLVIEGKCTWFGGPNDNQDTGETASGAVNTRRQPDFQGCALPMNGFRRSQRTLGSPIPRFKWLTPVEVECREEDLRGRRITVPLIDLGPARQTKHALDLTEPAFNSLGAASRRGVIDVIFRIKDWRSRLHPGASFADVPKSSSEQKPLAPDGTKIVPSPSLQGFAIDDFRAFIASLKLTFITADELLPYFTAVRGGVRNEPPPPALWHNFAPTLLVLDRLRAKLNAPLSITSSYRAPRYNRQLDGAAGLSQHMAFRAADIQISGKKPREVYAEARALRGTRIVIPAGAQFRAAGMINSGPIDADTPFSVAGLQIQDATGQAPGSFLFEGGLGRYETFVHVDCRGIHSDW
jgi:hypothetical protein